MDEQQDKQQYEGKAVLLEQPKKKVFGEVLAFLKQVFFGICWAMGGYLLGGVALPFGARPFGVALLGGTDRRIFYIYAGLCLAAWKDPYRILWIGIYSAILIVRLVARFVLDPPWEASEGKNIGEKSLGEVYPLLFSEHISLRMSTACLGAFAFGIYRLIEGGFLYYDLYGTILSAVVAPVSVILFGGIFASESEVSETRKTVGILSLSAVILYGMGDWKIYGVSLAVLSCMILTLWMTRKRGIIVGTIVGTVGGLGVSVSLSPLFAFAALAAGLLFPISSALAMMAAFSAAVAWGIYVSRLGILDGVLSALISSVVLFFVWEKLFLDVSEEQTDEIAEQPEERAVCLPLSESSLWELRLWEVCRRIKRLSESFSSLSELFFEIGKQMQTPTASDLREICDRAFEDSCASCSEKDRCWGEQYRVMAAEVGELSSVLHIHGRVEMTQVGKELRSRCGRMPDILEEINHNAAQHQKQIMQGDRTEVFALDYGAISELLAVSMVMQEREMVCDPALGEALCRALDEASLGIVSAGVYGTHRRKVRLAARDAGALSHAKAQLYEIVQRVCPFAIEEGVISQENEPVMEFWEKETLSLSFAKRTLLAAEEEKYCGDTAGVFRGEEGQFFALISDGMGSGREAALTSGVSAAYLRKMIDAGCSCEMAVRMLNEFLRNRGSGSLHECSATVDLMELDLMRGKAAFYKNGAAPTYVFRSGGIFKLRSRTVPVGIIRESDTRKIGFDVTAGDMIVMVSDGVTQGKEECPWLFDLLRSQGEDVSVDRIADLVVKYAKGEGASDDLSVLVMKIGENKE